MGTDAGAGAKQKGAAQGHGAGSADSVVEAACDRLDQCLVAHA